MKRENEGSQQQMNEEEYDPHQSTDSQDQESNENSMNNQNQDGGPINPAKRQRRNDDEEIRLLIPSKVGFLLNIVIYTRLYSRLNIDLIHFHFHFVINKKIIIMM